MGKMKELAMEIEAIGADPDLLARVINAGYSPVAITKLCGETALFFETDEEALRGWGQFKYSGWWDGVGELQETMEWYQNEMAFTADQMPEVIYLDPKYKPSK